MATYASEHRYIQVGNPFQDALRLAGNTPFNLIFDVGASDGEIIPHLRASFPDASIAAFEPHEASRKILGEHIHTDPKIFIVPAAVGARTETGVLRTFGAPGLNSLMPLAAAAAPFIEGFDSTPLPDQQTDVITIDEFCERHALKGIDFLKMDIQGAEGLALEGAERMLAKGAITFIYTEVLFQELYEGQAYAHEIAAILHGHGYHLVSYYALAFNKHGTLAYADALYAAPSITVP